MKCKFITFIFNIRQEYELYNEVKYLYSEGNFEDNSIKNDKRTDFTLQCNVNFFKKSKHQQMSKLIQLIYYLPFELNSKYSGFNLQVNDYISISYFQKEKSFISLTRDSSFKLDTGKKLTAMIFLFPQELEVIKHNK